MLKKLLQRLIKEPTVKVTAIGFDKDGQVIPELVSNSGICSSLSGQTYINLELEYKQKPRDEYYTPQRIIHLYSVQCVFNDWVGHILRLDRLNNSRDFLEMQAGDMYVVRIPWSKQLSATLPANIAAQIASTAQ